MGSWNSIPNLPAGHLPTADELAKITDLLQAIPQWLGPKVKTADQTVNNSATFVDDTHMQGISLAASATYIVDLFGTQSSGATPDMKMQFVGPAGASASTCGYDMGVSTTAPYVAVNPFTTPLVWGGNGGTAAFYVTGYITTGVTAGSFKIQWAQNTANASNTILKAGTRIQLVRIA